MPVSTVDSSSNISDSLNIFSNGNVGIGDKIDISDLLGAFGAGVLSYILIVGLFLFGFMFTLGYYFESQAPSGKSVSPESGANVLKLLLMPLSWLTMGVVIFVFLSVLVKWNYNVDMFSRIQFFWEARMSVLEPNLVVKANQLAIAKTTLMFLEMASQFLFWSIPAILIFFYIMIGGYLIAIISSLNMGGGDMSSMALLKRVVNSGLTLVVGVVLVTAFSVATSTFLFSTSPNIEGVGKVSSTIEITKKSIGFWVRTGLINVR